MKYPAYLEYKESGVEWLGEVPKHWAIKAARHQYSIQLGKMLQTEPSGVPESEVPYLKAQHVQQGYARTDDLPLMWASLRELEVYGIVDGDLLVCEGGDVGRAAIAEGLPGGTIIQNALHRVRSKECSTRYLKYLLEHSKSQGWFDILCNRSTIAHFTSEKFNALMVPEPPFEEQSKITQFLDAKTAKIDELIAKKRELIEKLKEKRSALIARTVTQGLPPEAALAVGLDPYPKMKDSGVEWLGQIPEHWTGMRAKNLCTKIVDCKNRTPEYFPDGEYPVVRTTDVKDGRLNFKQMLRTDEENFQIWTDRGAPEIGDVLFTREAPAGEAAIYDGSQSICLGQRMMYFRPNPVGLNPQFLLYWLYGEASKGYINSMSGGSTVTHLRVGQVHDFPISAPPVHEQLLIVAFLDSESGKLDALTAKTESAMYRLQEYRQALITAAVTGKIDVREAA